MLHPHRRVYQRNDLVVAIKIAGRDGQRHGPGAERASHAAERAILRALKIRQHPRLRIQQTGQALLQRLGLQLHSARRHFEEHALRVVLFGPVRGIEASRDHDAAGVMGDVAQQPSLIVLYSHEKERRTYTNAKRRHQQRRMIRYEPDERTRHRSAWVWPSIASV
jgi:hypothetical protein